MQILSSIYFCTIYNGGPGKNLPHTERCILKQIFLFTKILRHKENFYFLHLNGIKIKITRINSL